MVNFESLIWNGGFQAIDFGLQIPLSFEVLKSLKSLELPSVLSPGSNAVGPMSATSMAKRRRSLLTGKGPNELWRIPVYRH